MLRGQGEPDRVIIVYNDDEYKWCSDWNMKLGVQFVLCLSLVKPNTLIAWLCNFLFLYFSVHNSSFMWISDHIVWVVSKIDCYAEYWHIDIIKVYNDWAAVAQSL
jgi:hypothetical protein